MASGSVRHLEVEEEGRKQEGAHAPKSFTLEEQREVSFTLEGPYADSNTSSCCHRRTVAPSATVPLASTVPEESALKACRRQVCSKRAAPQQRDPLLPVPPTEILKGLVQDWGCRSNITRMHEVWSYPGVGGKARLCCGGLFVTGPPSIDRKFSLCAWISILLPTVFFFVVCGPFLWAVHPAWPIGGAALFFVTVVMLLSTSCTDPGIIPRPALQLIIPGLQEEVAKRIGLKGKPGGRKEDVMCCYPDPIIMSEIEPLGYWWCRWCHMIQPPRAKHCRDCDCCVLREDHHCPFLNNCIGERNYAFFYGFVVSLIIFGAYVVVGVAFWMKTSGAGSCLIHMGQCAQRGRFAIAFALIGFFVITVPGILVLFMTGFGLFHLYLIVRGRTTREVLTGRITGDGATLLSRRGPSLLHVRSRIQLPPGVDEQP